MTEDKVPLKVFRQGSLAIGTERDNPRNKENNYEGDYGSSSSKNSRHYKAVERRMK